MKTSIKLNPYKIVWAITVLNNTFKAEHYPNIEVLKSKLSAKQGSKVYIITDKQYGLIQNSWNGTTPEVAKPFTHSLTMNNKGCISVIPLTKKQFENPIIF
jgi:hypothetical protein